MKLILAIWLILLPTGLAGQNSTPGTIAGIVINGEDSVSLSGANITLGGTVLGASTDSKGKFVLRNVPEGTYSITISRVGFQRTSLGDVSVRSGEITRLAIALNPDVIQTAAVVVTASRREQSLQDAPASMSVIDENTLSSRHTITLDDALRYVPGVNVTQSQVNIRGSTGYSYGVGSRVLLLVDGLPMLSGDTGEIIWESLPVAEIDRVEVVKGSGSALYGSNALGGVINIIPKTPQEQPLTRIRLYGGSYAQPKYRTWQWTDDSRTLSGMQVSHQQRLGDVSVTFSGSRTLNDGYRQNDFWKRWNGTARVKLDFTPYQSASVSFSVLDQERGNFLYWKDFNHALQPPPDQSGQSVQSLRWNLGGGYTQIVSEKWFATTRVNWFRSKWDDNISGGAATNGTHSTSNVATGEFQVTGELPGDHLLVAGISGNLNSVDAATIFGVHSGDGAAMYAQDEIKLHESVRLTLGARYDYQHIEDVEDFSQVNPKLGLVYTPDPLTTLRLSAGRGFRVPSIAELFTTSGAAGVTIAPNPGLQPERSWSFEAGGSHEFNDHLRADLSLFRNEFWDLIEPAFGNDGIVHFENITRARIHGAELALQLSVLDKHLVSQISYTYVYPQDVSNDDILKYRPRNLLSVLTQCTVPPVQLGVDVRYLSRIERIDDDFVTLGIIPGGDERVPITVVDARIGADWSFAGLPLTSAVHVNNLFQYYYVELIGNIAPVRNYVLTLERLF